MRLRHRCRFESFEQDSAGVVAEVSDLDTGKRERIAAQNLIACRGGHGTVRSELGIELQGLPGEGFPVHIFFRAEAPADDTSRYVPPSHAGFRAPHVRLADGRSTIDLFGSGFVPPRLGDDAPDAGPFARAPRRPGRRGDAVSKTSSKYPIWVAMKVAFGAIITTIVAVNRAVLG